MTATPTRPTGEQLRFVSANTGEHVLDTYLEAAEKGGRTLADMLDDLFDSTTGDFDGDLIEFRYDDSTENLQVRAGTFADPAAGWSTITPLFRQQGAFSNATTYDNLDVVTLSNDDVYIVHGLASPQTFADEAAFIASSNTARIINLEAVRTEASNAADSAAAAAASAATAASPTLAAMEDFTNSVFAQWRRARA